RTGPGVDACRELNAELDSLESMSDNLMMSLELESQHQLVLNLEEFDLVDLVERTCRGLQRTSTDHVILFEPSVKTCVVTADESKIRSTVVNLAGNAVKYSPSGGRIWVRLTPTVNNVQIAVEDEGIGLDARDVETIFERYGRGDTALQHGIRGHGLGLFICRRIAESHGGTIYARPRPTGSCFTLVLPRRQRVGEP